jgi:dTDP-4-dehydrorhamnose 3,5-epimerase
MQIEEASISDVKIITPDKYADERGFFFESWEKSRYQDIGINEDFVQDNISYSKKNVIRGLHFQNPNSQGKLVYVIVGEVFDVAADIRKGSPTFGQTVEILLSSTNLKQLYIPPGFAHGFCVVSDYALFCYKCTDIYNSSAEHCITWNDPSLGINWPILDPVISLKDENGMLLADIDANHLPNYQDTSR